MTNRTMIMLRGHPASGKTTYSRQLLEEYPDRYIRINKEEVRRMLFLGDKKNCFTGETPYWRGKGAEFGKKVCNVIVKMAFREGYDVIVDGCNMTKQHEKFYKGMTRNKARFVIHDMNVPIEICERRNAERIEPVGEVYFINAKNEQQTVN